MANIPPPPPEEELYSSRGVPPPPPEEDLFTKEASPKFYEIEKQQGVPKGPMDFIKQVGRQFKDAALDPMPGSLFTLPAKAASETAQQAGADIARVAEPSMGTVPARVTGFAAAGALDPSTYVGAKLPFGNTPVIKGLGAAIEERLPGLFKGLARVPESATKTFIEEGYKLPKATAKAEEALTEQVQTAYKNLKKQAEVPQVAKQIKEAATRKVQDALKYAVDKYGQALNAAKKAAGLPVELAEKEKSMLEHGNVFGVDTSTKKEVLELLGENGKEIAAHIDMSPEALGGVPKTKESLVKAIAKFRDNAGRLSDQTKVKIAHYLQDRINNFVDWNKRGDQVDGLLKNMYGELSDIGVPESLQNSKSNMKEALDLLDDLKGKLGDEPGKAQAFLQRLFTKDTPVNQAYLQKLAELEVKSGRPILSELKSAFTPRTAPAHLQELIDGLENSLGKGSGKAQKFLQSVFLSNDVSKKDAMALLQKLDGVSKTKLMDELRKHFSSRAINKLVSRPGLETLGGAGGLALAAMLHSHATALATATALAAQSPRVLAKTASVTAKYAPKLGALSAGFGIGAANRAVLLKLRQKLMEIEGSNNVHRKH